MVDNKNSVTIDRQSEYTNISEQQELNYKNTAIQKKSKCPFKNQAIFWNKILLKKGITKTNFLASLVHYTMMTFIFVSVEILQPELLSQKFGISPQNAGTQNSNILMIDTVVKIIFAPFFGILADKFGRQLVLLYGILTVGLALFLMPFSTSLYGGYLPLRCFYAQGAICIAIIPLLADYVKDESKGKASSIDVVMASLGAVMSADLVAGYLVGAQMDINYLYWSVSGIYLFISIIYCLFLKKGKPQFDNTDNNNFKTDQNQQIQEIEQQEQQQNMQDRQLQSENKFKNCCFMMKIGWKASQNPWILMGYMANLLARNDSILLSLYIVIWTYDQTGQDDYDKAYYQGHVLAGIAYMSLFLFTIVYGLLMEKFSKFITIFVMLALTALGGFMMFFAKNPYDAYSYIVMVVLGSGMSGLQTASLYLIQKYSYKNYRGYISGLSGIFSVLGILICVLTGYLVDNVSNIAPFIGVSILSLIALGFLGYAYYRHIQMANKWKNTLNEEHRDIYNQYKNMKNRSEAEDLFYKEEMVMEEK